MQHDCVYVTANWGVHDDRWVAGLREVGLAPQAISLGRDAHDTAELRARVQGAAGDRLPVLAGPLDTITARLAVLPVRLVGLSWGYDLVDLDATGEDLHWLTELRGIIVDSRANGVIAARAGVDAERITYLPWGVDLSTFHVRDPHIRIHIPGIPDEAPIVLSLRAHEPLYRVGDVIEAFGLISTARHDDGPPSVPHLVIGHTGSLTEQLRALAIERGVGDQVHFIGSLPEDQLAPLLHRADCYVTAAEVDGTSVTLLQAMACGAPVVASDAAGNLGWIEDGVTGRTFATGDATALAEALNRTLGSYPAGEVQRARLLVEQEADWHANLERLRATMVAAGQGARP
jgi:glycosyltransferase involved in cell wall biosynthesis